VLAHLLRPEPGCAPAGRNAACPGCLERQSGRLPVSLHEDGCCAPAPGARPREAAMLTLPYPNPTLAPGARPREAALLVQDVQDAERAALDEVQHVLVVHELDVGPVDGLALVLRLRGVRVGSCDVHSQVAG